MADLFDTFRIARGYAADRPSRHVLAFHEAQHCLQPSYSAAIGLDVGCGVGASSVALAEFMGGAFAIDPSVAMLSERIRDERIIYAAGSAENLPFKSSQFDLVSACGVLEWTDHREFISEARRVLRSSGRLMVYDVGDITSDLDQTGLGNWYRENFLNHFPKPPRGSRQIDVGLLSLAGFDCVYKKTFSDFVSFDLTSYVKFILTESMVTAYLSRHEVSEGAVKAWLHTEVTPFFDSARQIAFGGWVEVYTTADSL